MNETVEEKKNNPLSGLLQAMRGDSFSAHIESVEIADKTLDTSTSLLSMAKSTNGTLHRLYDFFVGDDLNKKEQQREFMAALDKIAESNGGDESNSSVENVEVSKFGKGLLGTLGGLFITGQALERATQLLKSIKNFSAPALLQKLKIIGKGSLFSKVTKMLSFTQGTKRLERLTKAVKGLFIGDGIFANVGKFIKGMGQTKSGKILLESVSKFSKMFKPVIGIFKSMGVMLKPFTPLLKGLGRIFGWPLTVLMGVIGGIRGAMKGYKEGGVSEMFKQGIVGIADGLIGWLVDLGADAIGWLLGKMGVEDWSEKFKNFEFYEWLNDAINNGAETSRKLSEWMSGKARDLKLLKDNTIGKFNEKKESFLEKKESFLNIVSAFTEVGDLVMMDVQKDLEALKVKVNDIKESVMSFFSRIGNVVDLIDKFIVDSIAKIDSKIPSFIKDKINVIPTKSEVSKAIREKKKEIREKFDKANSKVADGFTSAFEEISNVTKKLSSDAIEPIREASVSGSFFNENKHTTVVVTNNNVSTNNIVNPSIPSTTLVRARR